MKEVGEIDATGPLTLLEVLVFKTILIYFTLNGLEFRVHDISIAYNKVCTLSRISEFVAFPLFDSSMQDIEHFLSSHFTALELLKLLFDLITLTKLM